MSDWEAKYAADASVAIWIVTCGGLIGISDLARFKPSRRGRDSRIVKVIIGHDGDLNRSVSAANIVDEFDKVIIVIGFCLSRGGGNWVIYLVKFIAS
jgi:hypothetical protein